MTRIVHFGKYYPPDRGGIESITRSLARGAVAQGHEVTVVCFGSAELPGRSNDGGVCVNRVSPTFKAASQPVGLRYVLACVREGRRADLVHLHGPNMVAALCSLFVGRRPRLLVHWHADVINKGLLGRLLRPLERAMLSRADCIVAASPIYAQASCALQPFQDKVTVIPYGVPDASEQRVDGGERLPDDLHRWLQGRRLVLSVGRLVPYKGFEVLVEASRRLPADVAVVIVGSGPLRVDLEAAIRRAGVADRVLLAGNLPNAAMHSLFRRADVYCLPSVHRAEAFGVVLLEAMAHSVPVVASRIEGSGVSWVNQESVSGVNVPVGDPAALAAACNRILEDRGERQRLASGARRRYLGEFTETLFANRILQAYARMTGRPVTLPS